MSELQKLCIAFLFVTGITLAGGFGFKFGQRIGYQRGYDDALNLPHIVDTVFVTDTFRQKFPIPQYVYRDRPVFIPIHDTTIIHKNDTTWVILDREVKRYADSTYQCEISGIQPQLDWIEVYQKTAYISNTIVKRQHWGASITAGPGFVWNGEIHGGLGIVAGLSYSF